MNSWGHFKHSGDDGALAQIAEEVRKDGANADSLGVDWDRVGSELFRRIASERRAEAALHWKERAWPLAGLAVAIAAVVTLVAKGTGLSSTINWAPPHSEETDTAGTLRSSFPSADVQVNGVRADYGCAVASGDTISILAGEGIFDRADSVRWALEERATAVVRRTRAPTVLELERGAIEAQVVHVDRGEAFAVDLRSMRGEVTRIAVHGTHLRVQRAQSSDHVVLDLSEGVVSIGVPPRVGSTYGALITAPAHVEFDLPLTAETLRIDRDVAAVRAASPLVIPNDAPSSEEGATSAGQPIVNPAPTIGRGPSLRASSIVRRPPEAKTHSDSPDPQAEETVATAVHDCGIEYPRALNVEVTVTSTLELRVGGDGFVQYARFDPPLAPETQACAQKVIFRVRFPKEGTVKIPLQWR